MRQKDIDTKTLQNLMNQITNFQLVSRLSTFYLLFLNRLINCYKHGYLIMVHIRYSTYQTIITL